MVMVDLKEFIYLKGKKANRNLSLTCQKLKIIKKKVTPSPSPPYLIYKKIDLLFFTAVSENSTGMNLSIKRRSKSELDKSV